MVRYIVYLKIDPETTVVSDVLIELVANEDTGCWFQVDDLKWPEEQGSVEETGR